MDRIDKHEVNGLAQKKNSSNTRFKVFISPFTDVECDGVELDVTSENMALMKVDFATCVESTSDNASEVAESETGPVTTETGTVTTEMS